MKLPGLRLYSALSSRPLCLLGILLLIGGLLRAYSLSHGSSFHPDERHIVMVTEGLKLSNMNPKSFAYGSFPFYFSWATSRALGYFWPHLMRYDGLFLVGRGIAVFFGLACIALTYWLGWLTYRSRRIALLGAALLTFNVFHLQLSRFFTVDIFLTTICIAALAACVRLAENDRLRDYVLVGICLGFAAATKISALTLLAPFVTAVALQETRIRDLFTLRKFFLVLSTLLLGALVFSVLEPYALLDYDLFRRQTKEQTDMIQGLWRPPYTVQYEGTQPYLYVLSQMFFYTMGIPLAAACFIGFLIAGLRQFRKIQPGELIILSWIIPLFIAFGGLQVKFPRYFLPIYPALFIFAAYILVRISEHLAETKFRRLKNVPLALVLGWCCFYALAFVRIYSVDHGYELATRWVFENVPSGSRILGVHWDDKLPLTLPGLDARRFQMEGAALELPLYDRDSAEKIDDLVNKLSKSDYIVFPTARTYGSIPRVPNEFALTTNFLRLLFAEKLGYRLIQTVKVRPQLGPIVFNDDLADESFSVYDHPKISIFKKVEALLPAEMRQRIIEPYDFLPLPTLNDMLLADAGSSALPQSKVLPSFGAVLLWLIVLELLGLFAFPLAAALLPRSPDHGYGISKTLGLLLVGFSVWICGTFRLLPTNSAVAWGATGILALAGLFIFKKTALLAQIRARQSQRQIRAAEVLFFAGFVLFLICRAFSPEIFWGEKPMDFTFLNFFNRLTTLPPEDPWSAGQTMRYYYYGTFLMSLLHKLSGIDSAIGYNLCLATLGGLALSCGYTVFLSLTRRLWPAIFGTLALSLLSNIEVVRLIFFGKAKDFDLFWASSRILTSPGITEYPLWALLFADLHAHVIAYPIALTLLALSTRLLTLERDSLSLSLVAHRLACGLTLGTLFATNIWDAIAYGVIFSAIFLYRIILLLLKKRKFFRRLFTAISDGLRDAPLVALGALPIVLPFMFFSASDVELGYGFNQRDEFDKLDQILRHLSHWMGPITLGFIVLAVGQIARKPRRILPLISQFFFALIAGSVPLLIGLLTSPLSRFRPAPALRSLPWSILALCSALAFLAAFIALGRRERRTVRVAALFCYVASVIMAIVEICFLIDHMNTIFKFYNSIWALLGISAGLLIPITIQRLWNAQPRLVSWGATRPLCFCLAGVLAISAAGSVFNVYTMTTFRRIAGPRPTLDGTAYLFLRNPDEAQAIRWIRANIKGTPVLLEAFGSSYAEFTRISMNTGLPTVLGWEHHISQRGTPAQIIEERKNLIREIYSSHDPESAMARLQQLNVSLVYIGDVEHELYERGVYDHAGLEKWDLHPDLFQPLYRSGNCVIYKMTWARLP